MIGRVDVAATGPPPPVPPGHPGATRAGRVLRFAGAGEAAAEPTADHCATAVSRAGRSGQSVRRHCPPRHRWSSSSVIGVDQLSHQAKAGRSRRCHQHDTPEHTATGLLRDRHRCQRNRLVLAVVAAALLFPVLIFIGVGHAAIGGTAGTAIRRDASGRRDAPSGHPDLNGRVHGRRGHRHGSRLRAVLRPAATTGPHPVHRRRRSSLSDLSLSPLRGRARRARRPARRGGRLPPRAASGHDFPAGRDATGDTRPASAVPTVRCSSPDSPSSAISSLPADPGRPMARSSPSPLASWSRWPAFSSPVRG